jgi:hypothetical protein
MSSVEEFCQQWAGKPNTSEGRMSEAHRRTQAKFESQQTAIVRCLRIEKKGNELIPAFAPEATELAGQHWDAEKRLADIEADIESFMELTNGETSLSTLADKLSRARRVVSDAELDARNALERAIRRGARSVAEAEQSPEVQKAFDKRDRLATEIGPTIQEVERKIADAKTILEKYS